jgi:phage replication O-like protein O
MPQLEDGYTRVANEILEKIAKTKLNGTQFRILMIVWRSTYGWNKKEYSLSLTYLANATEINKQQIKREVDSMIDRNILVVTTESTYTSSREIAFNKNYATTKKNTVSKKVDSKLKSLHTVSELEYTGVSELEYQKRNIKKQTKRNIYITVFNHYLTKENLTKHKQITEPMEKAIDKAIKQYSLDEEYLIRIIDRHSEKVFKTRNEGQYAKRVRSLSELFGQKKKDSTDLILADYLDENYTEVAQNKKTESNKILEEYGIRL